MCFFFLFLLMELISNIRSFYLSWRMLLSIFSESDQLATNFEYVFIFHSFLKYSGFKTFSWLFLTLCIYQLATFCPPFFTMKSQLFGSLVCDQSYFYLMFKIFSLFSFNILFLWYISVWISLPSLRIIDLGVNILHPIYKVINHYIFEIFKFLLLSSSPQELWLYLRYCSQWSLTFLKAMFILLFFFFLFVLRFIISTDLFSSLLILLLAQFYCLESLIHIFFFSFLLVFYIPEA